MYKILLCYAQTHKYIIYIERLRERQSITVQRERENEEPFDEEGVEEIRKREREMMMMRRRKSFSEEEKKRKQREKNFEEEKNHNTCPGKYLSFNRDILGWKFLI